MKRLLHLLVITTLFLISCQNQKKENRTLKSSKNLYCYPPASSSSSDLLGKFFLSSKYLNTISKVQTNLEKANSTKGMIFIKGGTFSMGADMPSNYQNMNPTALPQKDEYPKHEVKINDFYMDKHEVTIGEFQEFVKATNYITVAELDINWDDIKAQVPAGTPKPSNESLKAGSLIFTYKTAAKHKNTLYDWWTFKKDVSWKNPDGLHPNISEIKNHPVTHISWYDALAYAKWKGKRLPTEAEYEYAMRGGQHNTMYPWGNETLTSSTVQGNFFQGDFPYTNTSEDGFKKAAPVMSFPPNGYGLYDISGNVWEWTMDWYSATYDHTTNKSNILNNPKGPEQTFEVYDTNAVNKIVRGGSFLCNDSWCSGYRNARRMRLSPDSGMEHLGFRLVTHIQTN